MRIALVAMVVMALLAATSVVLAAEGTWTYTQKIDVGRGEEPSYVSDLVDPDGWELFAAYGQGLVLEPGRLVPIPSWSSNRLSVYGGGYISWWDEPNQLYLEPWLGGCYKLGDGWTFNADLAAYVPISGNGKWCLYLSEGSVMKQMGRWSAGLAAITWDQEGGECDSTSIGPKIGYNSGDNQFVARYLIGEDENEARFAWSTTIK